MTLLKGPSVTRERYRRESTISEIRVFKEFFSFFKPIVFLLIISPFLKLFHHFFTFSGEKSEKTVKRTVYPGSASAIGGKNNEFLKQGENEGAGKNQRHKWGCA